MEKLSFISDELVKIDLAEDTWVKIRESLPFETFREIVSCLNSESSAAENLKVALPLLKASIVEWSDEDVPCTPENIEKLSSAVIMGLSGKILPIYSPEKKS
jgi:hypothetical protein